MSGKDKFLSKEDEDKSIFSCIPLMVTQIEQDESVKQYSTDKEREVYYKQHGIKLDQNNKVVKIKYNSADLIAYLTKKNILANNTFNFYIGSYLDNLTDTRKKDSLNGEDIKVFAKVSKKSQVNVTASEYRKYEIGQGAFGKVKKVTIRNQEVAQDVVMKKIDKTKVIEGQIENEITALQAMGQYRGYVEIGQFAYIFSDFVTGSYLSKDSCDGLTKLLIADQLVSQLISLHSKGIFHFDIKLNNMLYRITEPIKAQFIDFGSVRILRNGELPDIDKISPEGMTLCVNVPPEARIIRDELSSQLGINDEAQYIPEAYAKVDIFQLGLLFRSIGLPADIHESMIKENPLERDSLEEVKKKINTYTKNIILLALKDRINNQNKDNDKKIREIAPILPVMMPRSRRLRHKSLRVEQHPERLPSIPDSNQASALPPPKRYKRKDHNNH